MGVSNWSLASFSPSHPHYSALLLAVSKTQLLRHHFAVLNQSGPGAFPRSVSRLSFQLFMTHTLNSGQTCSVLFPECFLCPSTLHQCSSCLFLECTPVEPPGIHLLKVYSSANIHFDETFSTRPSRALLAPICTSVDPWFPSIEPFFLSQVAHQSCLRIY